ncbi:phosphofurin acidic cluster sorting 2-like isoform X3 [Brachionus plicatilis]|uniref:Phosphofurin acidic cluster sorting 2-like isoform X3 n=1 Tax=Brachionus plicatilis TaxID=10195 RepID=A0A3M7QK09_BRAPC|nr:phosphofurin acidic cluster sorting 2-like isoform X3 [Brachionus plicatilis]
MMRLSKKPKDIEGKKEIVEGLSRLVCTSRNPGSPFNVWIDDSEYVNIKFLQISSLWQGKLVYINIARANNAQQI